jgi:hypothetical protein
MSAYTTFVGHSVAKVGPTPSPTAPTVRPQDGPSAAITESTGYQWVKVQLHAQDLIRLNSMIRQRKATIRSRGDALRVVVNEGLKALGY